MLVEDFDSAAQNLYNKVEKLLHAIKVKAVKIEGNKSVIDELKHAKSAFVIFKGSKDGRRKHPQKRKFRWP